MLRRMLAVTHETTLTGAPMNLLHFLTWVRDHTDVEVHTLVVQDGPLRHRFEQVSEVTVLDRSAVAKLLGTAQGGLLSLGSSRAWKPVAVARLVPQLRHLRDFDLVYSNSIASTAVLPYLPPARAVVSHVHELHVAMRTWRPAEHVRALRELPDAWIAASGAVRAMLVNEFRLPSDRVLLHHEFIDTAAITDRRLTLRETERHRRELGLPADAAVVVGAGTLDWRKGPDLFVQLAAEVRRRTREPVSFIWVGGDRTGTDWQRIRSDIERTGSDQVHFIGLKPDPVPWFALADVFALTSREDPYPLVCLENAVLGTPIVTYRNGGIPELLEAAGRDAATGIVDHLDVGALAERTLAFLESDELHQRAGRQLRDHTLRHHDVHNAAPLLLADLRRLTQEALPGRNAIHQATAMGAQAADGSPPLP